MFDFIVLTLATFWAWETLRFPFKGFLPRAYAALAPVHPLVVAALPLAVLWPDWVLALGVAGAVGVLHSLLVRSTSQETPVVIPRGRMTGLPELPGR